MSVLTPGEAAVLTLNDKFFYVSLAMLITALVAAAQWDALSLDQRDAAILDPLPVPPGDRSLGQADRRGDARRRAWRWPSTRSRPWSFRGCCRSACDR